MKIIIKEQGLFGKNTGDEVGVSLSRAIYLVDSEKAEHIDTKAVEKALKIDKAEKLKAKKEAEKETAVSKKNKETR